MATKRKLINRKFPHINTFDHEVPTVVNAMHDLTIVIFEHLYITSDTDVDQREKFTERILIAPSLNKYRTILLV